MSLSFLFRKKSSLLLLPWQNLLQGSTTCWIYFMNKCRKKRSFEQKVGPDKRLPAVLWNLFCSSWDVSLHNSELQMQMAETWPPRSVLPAVFVCSRSGCRAGAGWGAETGSAAPLASSKAPSREQEHSLVWFMPNSTLLIPADLGGYVFMLRGFAARLKIFDTSLWKQGSRLIRR